MDRTKVFDKASSPYAAATAYVALKDDALFENKASLVHALKTHAALNGYECKMPTSSATTFIAICKQGTDPDDGDDKKCPFRL